jgi:hypothetical protein
MLESRVDNCFHRDLLLETSRLGKGYWFYVFRVKINDSTQRDPLQDGKVTAMQEFTMKQAELEKVHVEIVKLMAEQRKLNAEAGKMTRETFWYPVAVATGLIGTVATVTAVLVKLL